MDSKVGGPAGHLADSALQKSNGGSQVKGLREIVVIHDLKKQGLPSRRLLGTSAPKKIARGVSVLATSAPYTR